MVSNAEARQSKASAFKTTEYGVTGPNGMVKFRLEIGAIGTMVYVDTRRANVPEREIEVHFNTWSEAHEYMAGLIASFIRERKI